MKMTNPELKVVRFANEDVLATSFYIVADPSSYTGYSQFAGTKYGPVDEGVWYVERSGGKWSISVDDINTLKNPGEYAPGEYYDVGQYITYDAYQTEVDGPYYTHGASYYELYGQH